MNDAVTTQTDMGDLIPADDTELAVPDWARPAVTAAVAWLKDADQLADATKTAYATALGIPRAEQTWRSAPTHRNVRQLPDPLSFFPWCVRERIDPLTEMTRDRLRAWLAAQTEKKVAKTTQKARLGAVSAWYREQRSQRRSTFEVAAALPSQERENLGVSNPDPAKPTVPLTMRQVRALRVAAELDPGTQRLRNRVVVALLTMTGISADELCSLRRQDVHRAGPEGTPALRIDGKGRKRRWAKLPLSALEMLDEYLDARDATEASREIGLPGQVSATSLDAGVFVTVSGKPLQPQHVTDLLRYLCGVLAKSRSASRTVRAHAAVLRAIAATILPHSARRFYAITADTHGVPVRQISLDLGHSSVAVTEQYLEQGRTFAGSAAGIIADLITAGEALVLIPAPDHRAR